MSKKNIRVRGVQTGETASDGGTQGHIMPSKGGRNATTEESRRAAGGMAPKPSGGAALLGNDRPSHPLQAGLARVQGRPSSGGGSFTPVQNNANANLTGTGAPYGGSGTPPAPRGGPSGLRAGGRNQGWPNGPMYTDSAKKGSSGKDSGPVSTRKPARRGRGAAFYGEY